MRRRLHVLSGALVLVISLGVPPAGSRTIADLGPGVTSTRIKIGYHAPFTGAVPLPSESVEKAARLYWQWRKEIRRPINGRHVEVVLKNDNYNPTQALAVCKDMVENDRVFMLVGVFAGVDQMQTCARYAARVGVPYLSLGMTKTGLTDLRPYFAITMPWKRQARMLADHLTHDLGARREKNGIVYFDTPNYGDSHDAFVNRMQRRRAPVDYDRPACRCSTATEAQQIVAEMKALEIENVYVLSSPTWFLQLLQAARSQDFHPLWLGTSIGGIAGRDSIASVGCRNGTLGGARFLTPFPALSDRDRFDPRFSRAMQRVYQGEDPDDVIWSGWAISKGIRQLLARTGQQLTRRRFIGSTSGARPVQTGILPGIDFRRNHFSDRAIHVVKARCNGNRWTTVREFVRRF